MSRVLVIAASMAQAEDMMRQHATHNYRDIEFRYPANISVKEASLQELYEDCCDVITDEEISAILSSKPSLQLVHSALLFDFPELRGPSFESTFLLLNRYYNKRVISIDFSPPFNIIDIDDISSETLASVLEDSGSSALQLKDIFATENALSKRLRTKLPSSRDLTRIKKQLIENGDRIRRFVSDFLHKSKYPLALDPICLIDEDWDPRKRPVTIHYVEGCVTDGIIVPWAISDVQYCRHKPTYLTVVGLPTALDEEVQMGVWAVFRETVQRLVERGFQDQFVHAKVAVLDDGSVKVTDMAGCLLADNTALYRHVLNHGDNWRAQMDIGLGDAMNTPRTLPERYAMKVRVVTFANGHEVGDVIDLQKARALSKVDLFVKNEDTVIKMIDEDDGLHLANIYLFSTSYDRCMEQLTEITDQILKKPSSTPPGVTTTIVTTPASDDDDDVVEDDEVDEQVISTGFRGRARRGSFFTLPSRYDVEPASTPDDIVGGNLLLAPSSAITIAPTIPEEPESPGQEEAPAAGSQPVDEGPTTDVVAPTESDSAERSSLQIGNAAANVKVRLTGAPIKQISLTDANASSPFSRKPALNVKLPPVSPRTPTIDSEARRFGSSMTLGLGQRLTVEMPALMKPRIPGKQVYLAAPGGAPTRGRMVSPTTPGKLSTSHVKQKPKPTSMAITGQHGSLKVLSQSSKPLKGSLSDTEPVSYRHATALREAKETKQRLAETKKVEEQAPPAKDTKVTFADTLPSGRDGYVPARAGIPTTRRSTIAPDSRAAGQLPMGEGDAPRHSSGASYRKQNNAHKPGGTVADKKISSRRRQTSNLNERTGSVT